jgi:fructose-1,6-bisphosphatase
MMEQKDTLQELFNGYTPDLGQEDLFMQHLEKKLQAVEYIKQMQDRQLRRYRYALIAAFLRGMIVSGGLFVYILDNPIGQPTISFGIHSLPFLFLEQNSRMISLTGLSLLMGVGIVVIITLWHEMASMHEMYGKRKTDLLY